jgi:mannose/fructose/N-acetylgalactosamine-specific phosphotransferase system component IID
MKYKITWNDFFLVYLRGFFYQNLINDKYFQNIGFMFTLFPIVKKVKKNKESIKIFLTSNFEYFNTNPYTASFILGVAIKLIHDNNESKLKKFKFDMMSPLAALGDAISWGILPSFLITLSTFFVFFGYNSGILIFFIFFNIILHIFFRFFGLIIGYKNGLNIIFRISEMNLQNKILMLKKLGLVIWGSGIFLLAKYKYNVLDFSRENGYIFSLINLFFIILIGGLAYKLDKYIIPVVTYIIFIMIMTMIYLFK